MTREKIREFVMKFAGELVSTSLVFKENIHVFSPTVIPADPHSVMIGSGRGDKTISTVQYTRALPGLKLTGGSFP